MATKKKAKKRDESLAGIDDGCESWLVEGARYDGLLEIPVIRRPERIAIPANMVPFSKRTFVDSPTVEVRPCGTDRVQQQKIHFILEE